MTTTNEALLTLDQVRNLETIDLLDLDMDMIPENPGFINPPKGIYLAELKLSSGTYDKKVYKDGQPTGDTVEEFKFSANFVIKNLLDVQEADLDKGTGEELPRIEDRFSKGYFGKAGIQDLVHDFSAVGKHLQVGTARALLETLTTNPIEVIVAVERTRRTVDGKLFLGVKLVQVEPNAE